jgi:TRAP transporter TAXI family solute receptor
MMIFWGGNMMSNSKRSLSLMACAAATAAIIFFSIQSAQAEQRKQLRWMTSPVGSYGYTFATSMKTIIDEALPGEYAVSVYPHPSTTIAMRSVMDGNGEVAYTADIGMTQFVHRVGGFTRYKPGKAELVHTWYAYQMESMLATSAKLAGRFKCWRDFSGQPVFYTNAGFMNWLNWRRIFDVLGYNLRHVQIDLQQNTRLLVDGTIVGSATYTTAGRSLASYWRDTEKRMDIRIVNPCPDEIEQIRAAGLTVVDLDPKEAFTRDVGPSVVQGVPILFGYNMRPDFPEDVVYRIVDAFYKNRDKLAKQVPGFGPAARDFVGLQAQGINANPEVPVHAGLAKFLREHNAWNDKWKVAGSGI